MDRALTDKPRRDELGVSVDRYPGPHIPIAVGALVLFRDVFLLRVTERPDLITFDRLGGEVGEFNVLVFGAGFPEIDQELGDGVLGCAGNAGDSAHAHAFDEAGDDLASAFCGKPVHTDYCT